MKFDEKFKNEMDLLSPSDEQIERIKKSVYERIDREKSDPANSPHFNEKPGKKPLKIKIAAISGTACACAAALAIIVTGSRGALKLPGMRGNSANFTNNAIGTKESLDYGAPGVAADGLAGSLGTTGGADEADNIFDACTSTGNAMIEGNTTSEAANYSTPAMSEADHITAPSAAVNSATNSYNTPYLSFSDDKESCTVTLNGKVLTYQKSEIYNTSAENGYAITEFGDLQNADDDFGEKLLVQFDENELYVFYRSGKLFGYYRAK